MRKINDLKKLVDIVRSCCPDGITVCGDFLDDTITIRAPFAPAILFDVVSSSVCVSVHPYSDYLLSIVLTVR